MLEKDTFQLFEVNTKYFDNLKVSSEMQKVATQRMDGPPREERDRGGRFIERSTSESEVEKSAVDREVCIHVDGNRGIFSSSHIEK